MKKLILYLLCFLLLLTGAFCIAPSVSLAQTTVKITELTEDTNPTSDDLMITVNDPSGTPANKKVKLENLGKGLSGVDASKIAGGSVSNTEYQYLDGATGNIQTQLDGKSATTHNHTGVYQPYDLDLETIAALACSNGQIIKRSAGGAWECAADSTGGSPSFDTIASGENSTATMTLGAGGSLSYTSTGIVNASQFRGVTSIDGTEFGYLDGATGNIQTQLDGKSATTHDHDSAYISIIGSPTAGNFPTITSGGELQNSSYGPSSFSAVGHTHTSSNITDFNEASQDSIGGIVTDTATIDFTYNDAGNQITAAVIADTSVQKTDIRKNTGGSNVGSRRRLNFIEGSNVTLTVSDDGTDNEVDITIAAPGASGYTTIQEEGSPLTQRTTFNFAGSGITAADDAGNTRTNVTLDATLNAIAGLTIGDVSIIEGTGADAFNVVSSGGNDYFLSSNSGNTALEFKTPAATLAAIGAAASSHTHAASDTTSGTFDNARVNWAAPGAIGSSEPAAGTFTTLGAGGGGFSVDADGDITGKSLTITKQSGIAGDVGLYEGNLTDTDTAGWRGPASLTADTSYRGQFPNAKATSGNMVLAWTNSGETGTGTPADPYVQATSFVDLDNYALTSSIIEPKGGHWDGAGSALSTSSYPGNKVLYVRIPFSGTITKWTVNADQNVGATAVVIDVWKLAYAADTYPTVANTMLATGTKPNIATGGHKTGQAVWDGAQSTITAGDWLAFKLDSTSTVTWVQITLDIQR